MSSANSLDIQDFDTVDKSLTHIYISRKVLGLIWTPVGLHSYFFVVVDLMLFHVTYCSLFDR